MHLHIGVKVLGEDRRIGFLFHALICAHVHTDNCDPQPCQNGGTCTPLPAGYNCSCPHGYEGSQCERGRCLVLTKIAGLGSFLWSNECI